MVVFVVCFDLFCWFVVFALCCGVCLLCLGCLLIWLDLLDRWCLIVLWSCFLYCCDLLLDEKFG